VSEPRPSHPADVVILSDLHFGEGRDPATGRASRLEDFFYDLELAEFVDHQRARAQAEGRPLRLLLAGDVFDFLLVTSCPDQEEAARLGLPPRRTERKFGLRPTEPASVWKLDRIIHGHPAIFAALGRLLAAGHELVVLPGNHDPELWFPAVQQRLVEQLVERACEASGCEPAQPFGDRIKFRPWFWLEPGRLFVEHGHQYEESSVIRRLLAPLHLGRKRAEQPELDLPVGSLLVRYLHNGLKLRNPYIRNFVSLDDYLRFLGAQDIHKTLPQAVRNAPFLLRALQEAPLFESPRVQRACREHDRQMDELDQAEDLGGALRQLEDAWPVAAGQTKARLVRKMVEPALRQAGVALLVLFVTLYAWAVLFNMILAVPWLAESPFGKAGWLVLLAVVTFAAVAVVARAAGRLLKTRGDTSFDSLEPHALRVAQLVGVPNVAMGHTHLADRRVMKGGAVFINTGTWTAIQGPWDEIRPQALQFTFARLDPGGFHLLRWDPAARREEPVQLFEDPPERLIERILPGKGP
jgi:UDP-2,3-diacylglucosamine pyrophosphatase LpxH